MLRAIFLFTFIAALSACSTVDSSKEYSVKFYFNEQLSFEPELQDRSKNTSWSPFDSKLASEGDLGLSSFDSTLAAEEESVFVEMFRFIDIWHEKQLDKNDYDRIIELLDAWKKTPLNSGDNILLPRPFCAFRTVASFAVRESDSADDYWDIDLDYAPCHKIKSIVVFHRSIKKEDFRKILTTLRTIQISDEEVWGFFYRKRDEVQSINLSEFELSQPSK